MRQTKFDQFPLVTRAGFREQRAELGAHRGHAHVQRFRDVAGALLLQEVF